MAKQHHMEPVEEGVPSLLPVDEKKQGIFTRISFFWMNKVVGLARKGQLKEENLPLPVDQRAEVNFDLFQEQWAVEQKRTSEPKFNKKKPYEPSLLKALWRLYGKELMIGGIFKLLWGVFVIMGAFFFVRSLLQFVDPKVESPYDSTTAGYLLMVFFFVDAWLLGQYPSPVPLFASRFSTYASCPFLFPGAFCANPSQH